VTELFEDVLSLGYFGVFVFSLALNLVPFLSPSNLLIAGAVGSLFPSFNPLLAGFLVALGASIAKTVHYGASFFAGRFLGGKLQTKTNDSGRKHVFHRFGMIAAFVAAISPIPDDPIVIPLGLMRYSPLKFFAAYFSGKSIITITGAYLGQTLSLTIEQYFGDTAMIIVSAILTISMIIIITKKEKILKKLKEHRLFSLDRLHPEM